MITAAQPSAFTTATNAFNQIMGLPTTTYNPSMDASDDYDSSAQPTNTVTQQTMFTALTAAGCVAGAVGLAIGVITCLALAAIIAPIVILIAGGSGFAAGVTFAVLTAPFVIGTAALCFWKGSCCC